MANVLLEKGTTFEDFGEKEEQKEVELEEVEVLKTLEGREELQRKLLQYYDKQQQLELVLATHETLGNDDPNTNVTISKGEMKGCGFDMQ
jgi:D-ribose pyranose/furanose isomerase RbsD